VVRYRGIVCHDQNVDLSITNRNIPFMSTAAYLDRMLDPVSQCFTPEVADRLVHVQIDPTLQMRIDELADKCTEGELLDEERSEYEAYVRTGNLIAILQAKARKLLRNSGEQ
jgi:hypothetical protein